MKQVVKNTPIFIRIKHKNQPHNLLSSYSSTLVLAASRQMTEANKQASSPLVDCM
jgi:hypothetical protein